MSTDRYYAPGPSGLRRGDVLEPNPDDLTEIGVMLFTDRSRARLHAAGRALYRVDPVGPVAPFEDEGSAISPKARVVNVYDAHVTLTKNEKNRQRRRIDATIGRALGVAYEHGVRWGGR